MKEEHMKKVEEQRYKQLMHLLNKSKFYSSYILTKVEKSIQKEKADKKRNKLVINKENKAPSVKTTNRANLEKYDIRKYISADVSNKKNQNFVNLYIIKQ